MLVSWLLTSMGDSTSTSTSTTTKWLATAAATTTTTTTKINKNKNKNNKNNNKKNKNNHHHPHHHDCNCNNYNSNYNGSNDKGLAHVSGIPETLVHLFFSQSSVSSLKELKHVVRQCIQSLDEWWLDDIDSKWRDTNKVGAPARKKGN